MQHNVLVLCIRYRKTVFTQTLITLFSVCFCSELELFVASLQKDSAATHRVVTLKDVEEGAVTLRKVGESLAGLKGKMVIFVLLGTLVFF